MADSGAGKCLPLIFLRLSREILVEARRDEFDGIVQEGLKVSINEDGGSKVWTEDMSQW